jgi:hypothetical protein
MRLINVHTPCAAHPVHGLLTGAIQDGADTSKLASLDGPLTDYPS